ncbi:MAG: glucosyltransferase domain-containing protein [Flexilinea sp.]|nr:glucosyltransferase domain-containing protein [Flexilinea sp.]
MEFPEFWRKIQIQKRYAIVSTFVIGLLTHGPMMFNKFSKFDDIAYLFKGGVTFSSGRWMLFVAEKLKNQLFQDSIYGLPLINIVFSFSCVAAVLCIIIDLFDIKSINSSILLSGIFITIPVVACMYGYMFTAQFFAFAIFCAVLGAYLVLTKNQWYWIISGIVLMTCAVGIYQAYISLSVCIFLFGLIKRFSRAETNRERCMVFCRLGVVAVSCAAFLALNTIILNVFLRIYHTKLDGYKGIGYATKIPLSLYFKRALFAYREFFLPQRGTFYDTFPGGSRELFLFSVALTVVFFVIYLFSIAKKSKINAAIIFVLGLFVPVAVNFIFVMVDETYCYVMMVYGYAMHFVFLVWIFEQIKDTLSQHVKKTAEVVINAALCLIVIVFARFDNVCYMRLEMIQSQTSRYYTSLITRMQDTEGYRASMQVAYIGKPQILEDDTTIPEVQELNHVHVSPYWGFRESISTEPWRDFMEQWLLFKAWETENLSEFENLPEVQAMPHYPNKGSIKVINDTLVVKF